MMDKAKDAAAPAQDSLQQVQFYSFNYFVPFDLLES